MALLSKGITLGYKGDGGKFVTLTNLQEIAELGNNAPEKVDVTTLGDDAKKSIAGLADTAQDLPFKFIYDREQFEQLAALNESKMWLVTLPDGMKAHFNATPSVKIAGVGVSAPVAYTLTLSVESKVEWGEPPTDDVTFTIGSYMGGDAQTFTVPAGTTWATFIASNPIDDYTLAGGGDSDITVSGDGSQYIGLDGEKVKASDVIIATTYEWI